MYALTSPLWNWLLRSVTFTMILLLPLIQHSLLPYKTSGFPCLNAQRKRHQWKGSFLPQSPIKHGGFVHLSLQSSPLHFAALSCNCSLSLWPTPCPKPPPLPSSTFSQKVINLCHKQTYEQPPWPSQLHSCTRPSWVSSTYEVSRVPEEEDYRTETPRRN